jgi:cyclin ccl1
MDFTKSTQAREWTFQENSFRVLKATRQMNWDRIKNLEKLTVEEEDLLLNVFVRVFPNVLKQSYNFSDRLWAVAITYFRRFFIKQSIMDYDLKQCFFTCVLIACKAEEERKTDNKPFKYMCTRRKENDIDQAAVLALEYVILDELKFHIEVFTPYLSLTGFLIDIQTKLSDIVDFEQVKSIQKEAEGLVKIACTTEAILLFPPSQIALAALRYALLYKLSFEGTWDRYIILTFGHNDQFGEHWLLLDEAMNRIQKFFTEDPGGASQNQKDRIRMLNQKLKGIPKIPLL